MLKAKLLPLLISGLWLPEPAEFVKPGRRGAISGKSGGVRVMYYFRTNKNSIYFIDVYSKNEKENLSGKDKKIIVQLIEEIKKAEA